MFCLLNGPQHVFEFVNKAHIKALGFDATGMAVREAQPESVEVHGILDEVYNTGKTAHLHEIAVTLGKEVRYFDLTYAAKKNAQGIVDGIMILGNEVTERVIVDKKVKLERSRMYNFFEQIPAAIAVVSAKDYRFEVANNSYQKLVSKTNIVGRTIKEVLPELSEDIISIFKNVIETGERFIGKDFPISLDWENNGKVFSKYLDFIYEPITLANGVVEGILVFVYDVTEKYNSTQKVLASESKFKSFIDSMPQMIFMADAKGDIYAYNKRWYEYVGLPGTEGWGWKDRPVLHPDDLENSVRTWKNSLETGETYQAEYRIRKSTGEYRWHLGRAVPMRNAEGIITDWFGTNTDTHDLKSLKEAVTMTEEKLQFALNSGGLGLWHFDLKTNVVTSSDSLGKILGADEVTGDLKKINHMVIYPEDQAQNDAAIQRAIQEKVPYNSEFRIVRPSGELRWLSSSGQVKFDEQGTPVSISGVTLDITENKIYEEKLKAALKTREDFLSIASHELKTPLTSLKLRVQTAERMLMKDENYFSKEKALDIFRKNSEQVDRLVRLVDDMLDLSRVQSGRLSYNFMPLSLDKIVRESFNQFKEEFDSLSIELTLQTEEKEFVGRFDKERIEQVLTNLLTNALRYGDKKPVQIELRSMGENALIKVSDRGRGIAFEHYQKVFKKFERIISANEVSGLGIGLFITKEIVEAHGGRIWVESEVNFGSTFFVELPLK